MNTRKVIKLAGLNLGVVILNIILFSPGLLNIRPNGTNTFSVALGFTAAAMSIILFFYGNFKMLMAREKLPVRIDEINTADNCISYLQETDDKKLFKKEISLLLNQTERLQKKKGQIRSILLQKFGAIDKTYETFNEPLVDVDCFFFSNVKSILNKINVFDVDEYEKLNGDAGRMFSKAFMESKKALYNEHMSSIKKAIEDNEQVLLKLDQLMLEISKINYMEVGELENMNEIKEIDELIKKSRDFKQA